MDKPEVRAALERLREQAENTKQGGTVIVSYDDLHVALALAALPPAASEVGEPIPMVLFCPKCGLQHIDAAAAHPLSSKPRDGGEWWMNPPHRSHLCHGCGHIWRPADAATTGVASIQTRGKNDSPALAPKPSLQVPAGEVGQLTEEIVRNAHRHYLHDAELPCGASAMREAIELALAALQPSTSDPNQPKDPAA